MDVHLLLVALAFLAVALLGALPLLWRPWTHLGLHRLVSIAAGIFLGSVFLHLLPELARGGHAHGEAARHAEPSIWPWVALLLGFLLLFAVERVWLQGRARGQAEAADTHRLLLLATFVGLALHSLTMGLGLGALAHGLGADWPLLSSLLIHKGSEAFSLGAVMSLARQSRARSVFLLVVFALTTPLGLALGSAVADGPVLAPLMTGFACGTFLYVAVCDFLPEVFHDSEHGWGKLGWLVLGVGITALSLPEAGGAPVLLLRTLEASRDVLVEMAPLLLVGFLVAGVLSQWLRPERLSRLLAGDDLSSVAKASLIGAPLPLCSCSVLPVALSLRKAGASRGATSAFLIATPETGVDSVAVTWALLDPLMTLLRPVAAVVTAVTTGIGVNRWGRPRSGEGGSGSVRAADTCAHDAPPQASGSAAAPRPGFWQRALRYGYVDLLDDLSAALLLGILLSGAITAALPEDFFERAHLSGLGGMLLMLAVGVPIYVCAAASTPIAASMILKGLSPGAAFVFLMAGPATNLASLVALGKMLGRRALLVHVAGLVLVTLALGLAVDALYPALGFTPGASVGHEHGVLPAWVSLGAASLLGGLLLLSLYRVHGPGHASPASLPPARAGEIGD